VKKRWVIFHNLFSSYKNERGIYNTFLFPIRFGRRGTRWWDEKRGKEALGERERSEEG